MQCPRCGGATQQGPNGSWLCPNCGWGSGFAPSPAIAWLERQPINAYVQDGNGGWYRRDAMTDADHDSVGGAVGKLYSIKADHETLGPHLFCGWCNGARDSGTLVVVG